MDNAENSEAHDGARLVPTDAASNLEPVPATTPGVALELVTAFAAESADRRPAAVYLARLAPSGRRTMATALHTIAQIATNGQADALQMPWHELRYEHTQAIRAALAERYAPATANKHLAALRGALKAAWRLGLMPADAYQRACDLEPVRGTTLPAGRALSLGEIGALFAACAGTRPADVRDAALLAVLYGSGLRREETINLDLADYLVTDGTLTVNGKGRKQRLGHLASGADHALNAWIAIRGTTDGPLFVPINKASRLTMRRLTGQAIRLIVRKRVQQAGIASCTTHDFRRSHISGHLAAGTDINVVSKLAGHQNLTTTALYDRRPDQIQHEAARLLHIPYDPSAPTRDDKRPTNDKTSTAT